MTIKNYTVWPRLVKGVVMTIAAVALGTACQDLKDIQKLDPLKGVVFKINYEPSPTALQGLVVDAKTGEALSVPVQVNIYGPDASRVLTYEGVATTSFKSPKADLFLGLKGVVPTTAKPAELRIVVDAPGYIASSIYLFVDKAKPEPFEIRLVKENAPVGGVAIKQDVVETSATGAVKSDETITTPISASMTTSVTVQIPANTQLKDAKGQVVTGNLTAQVATFSSRMESSLQAFPGGFTTRVNKDDQGGANVVGTFTTAGFVSIELANASGQVVTTFSQPVTVNATVDNTMTNPETGQKLKSGDLIPVFSYNELTGEWVYERDAAVKQSSNVLQVAIPITHLSGYSLSFWAPSGASCAEGGQWTITGKPDGKPLNWTLYNGDQIYQSGSTAGNTISFPRPFSGAARLDLFSPDGKQIGTSTVSKLCGTHTVSVVYPVNLIDLDVAISAYCENKSDVQITPSAWVKYRKLGTNNWQQSFLTSGKGKLVGLEPNADYEAGVQYNGFNPITINAGQNTGTRMIEIKFSKDVSICQ
ncbi:hypothetical protein [Spirosoma pollinicola]|uniref:Uncharacterized protein n=1 Tax=Spirosoma pollinicola TaxID=2057025 RepID=A0A2K8Z3B1_9BACT|nr:hypothetical protein [Spirosoma pollinicola]AUD04352.1 hypothetical protein CWM47_22410 [Spirosoma pollinicola]